ncbi:MAG: hypothetical protein KF819_12360 [Labilithrix sp.]|nr:hypothetical protein [Labilithrix sp.]
MKRASVGLLSLLFFAACSSFGEAQTPPDGPVADAAADASSSDGDSDAGACSPKTGELVLDSTMTKIVDLEPAKADTVTGIQYQPGGNGCPLTLGSEDAVRFTFVVFNATASDAVLEAWAKCRSGDDTMSVIGYATDEPPSTPATILQCTEAAVGFQGTRSEDNGGSGWCKALLATKNQAIPIRRCGRAVVFFESPNLMQAPPTAALRLQPAR